MLKTNFFYYAIICFAFALIYPYIFDEKIFLGGDNAEYYSLGQGLASNMSYSSWSSPQAELANHFPPGYPLIIAICLKLGISSMYGLQIVNGLFLLGTAIFAFLLTNRISGNKIFGLLISIALLVNMHLLEYSTIVMSEVPFAFFMIFTLFYFIKFVDNEYRLKSAAFVFAILGAIALVYLRTQGIAVIGSFIFYLVVAKKIKIAGVFFVCFILAYLPWQIRSHALGGSSYVKQLMSVDPYLEKSEKMKVSDWTERIGSNTVRYISKEIPSLIFPHLTVVYKNPKTGDSTPSPWNFWLIGAATFCLSVFGAWKLKEFRWLILSFFGANWLIFMLWPQVWFGIRFILPMAPLILIILFVGLKSLFAQIIKMEFVQSGRIYPLFLVPFILISIQGVKKLHIKSEANHAQNWANFLLMAEWAKDNLKENAVVIARKPSLFFVKSDRKSKTFLYTPDRNEILKDFDKNKVTHVVLEQLGFNQTGKFLYPLISKEPDKFKIIHKIGATEGVDAKGKATTTNDGVWLFEYHPEFGYHGPYKKGLKNGAGTYKYSNGNIMTGIWVNDTIEGPGTYLMGKDQKQIGTWKKGKRNGKFVIILPDKRIESQWKNDSIQPLGYVIDENGKRLGPIRLK